MRSRTRFAAVAALIFCVFSLSGCNEVASFFRDPSPDIAAHLIAADKAETSPERPIDARESVELSDYVLPLSDEQYRDRVDELYGMVVNEGKKPVLKSDDPVKPVYDAAIAVLNRYILNSWHEDALGEERIVHTIHDYLAYNTSYDFDLYERFQHNESVDNDPAFDIDGVFLNKRAVCDGISSAFNFLCAIEGLQSMTVTGTFALVPHAWNKVRVDGNWYNVDVTADQANYKVNNGEYRKQLSHGYMLVSDDTLKTFSLRSHVFNTSVSATMNYAYYQDKSFDIDGKTYPCVIKNAAMLNEIFDAVKAANGKVGKLEVQLNFEGKTNINNGDMYESEIKEAYSRVPDADFKADGQKPYFQAPNGVYLFLIYK